MIIWSEYIANRLSFNTMTEDVLISTTKNLFSQIKSSEFNVKEAKEQFKKDKDAKKLIRSMQERTHLLLYFTGQLYGFLHCFNDKNKDTLLNAINENISKTHYESSWNKIGDALDTLYKKYPNWNDIEELQQLNNAVLNCWNNLFVFPIDCGNEIYVDVV